MRTLFVASLLILAASVQAQASSTPVLQPVGPWKVDYAQDECRLIRTFGSGDRQVVFRLARGSGLQQFDVVIAGKDVPKLPSKVPMTLSLDGQGSSPQSFDGYSARVPDRQERYVRWYDGDADALEDFGQNQVITVSAGGAYAVTLNLLAARPALLALNKCHEDLLAGWGLDLTLLKSAVKAPKPTGNPASWATTSDYPGRALGASQGGTVRFMVVVGADGKPNQCKVALSSGVPELDTVTCQLVMRRAKFQPALNAQGEPMVGYYVNRVRWLTPGD